MPLIAIASAALLASGVVLLGLIWSVSPPRWASGGWTLLVFLGALICAGLALAALAGALLVHAL